jgi:hypothetical protein
VVRRNRLLIADLVASALLLAALIAGLLLRSSGAAPANDPVAEHLYVRSIAKAVNQPRVTIDTVLTSTVAGDLGGIFRGVVTNRIRSVKHGVSVEDRRTGGLPSQP